MKTVTGNVVSIRGHDADDGEWDVIIQCGNRESDDVTRRCFRSTTASSSVTLRSCSDDRRAPAPPPAWSNRLMPRPASRRHRSCSVAPRAAGRLPRRRSPPHRLDPRQRRRRLCRQPRHRRQHRQHHPRRHLPAPGRRHPLPGHRHRTQQRRLLTPLQPPGRLHPPGQARRADPGPTNRPVPRPRLPHRHLDATPLRTRLRPPAQRCDGPLPTRRPPPRSAACPRTHPAGSASAFATTPRGGLRSGPTRSTPSHDPPTPPEPTQLPFGLPSENWLAWGATAPFPGSSGAVTQLCRDSDDTPLVHLPPSVDQRRHVHRLLPGDGDRRVYFLLINAAGNVSFPGPAVSLYTAPPVIPSKTPDPHGRVRKLNRPVSLFNMLSAGSEGAAARHRDAGREFPRRQHAGR